LQPPVGWSSVAQRVPFMVAELGRDPVAHDQRADTPLSIVGGAL
jgi:hypothetical protein